MNVINLLAAEGSFDITAYVVDIVVVAVAFIFMMVCSRKGFVNCVFGLLASVVAIVAAICFASVVVEATGGLFGLQEQFVASFTSSFSSIEGFNVVVEADANLAELFAAQDMSAILANLIATNFVEVPEGYTLGMLAGETVGGYAALLISGVVLYVIFRLCLSIVKKLFNFITSGTGLLGALNTVLGACVGLLEALIIASVAVAVCAMFPSLMEYMNSSVILTWIYNNNPLMWLLSLFLFI